MRILTVDPCGLSDAAKRLQSVVLPAAPTAAVIAGTDPAALAIKSTMPAVEAPVVDGLPATASAIRRTGSDMASAAAMYAEVDQTLSDAIARLSQITTGASHVGQTVAAQLQTGESQFGLATIMPSLALQQATPITQGLIQSAQAAAESSSGANAMPAQFVGDSGPAVSPCAQALEGEADGPGRDRHQQEPEPERSADLATPDTQPFDGDIPKDGSDSPDDGRQRSLESLPGRLLTTRSTEKRPVEGDL